MISSLSKLSPTALLSKVEKRFPRIKRVIGNEKLKLVAKHTFFTVGLTALGGGFGVLISAPFGIIFIAIGAGLGAFTGGITYLAILSVICLKRKYGFPAHSYRIVPPISIDIWLTDENHHIFQNVLKERLQPFPWFATWCSMQRLQSPGSIERHLWRKIQKGVAFGEAQGLMMASIQHKTAKGLELLKKITPEELYYRQLLHLIQQDFHRFHREKEYNLIDLEIKKCPQLEARIDITMSKLDVDHQHYFSTTLQQAIHDPEHPSLYGLLSLSSKSKSHAIFLQFSPAFSFYDPCSLRHAGLHEGFKSEDEFIRAVYRHLKGYHSHLRPFTLSFQNVHFSGYSSTRELTEAAI